VSELTDIEGPTAPPRRNGTVVFDAPWQGRVFGMAAAVIDDQFGGDREPFRQQLIAAIAEAPDRPYWESWTAALEALMVETGLVSQAAVDRAERSLP
jgi:hypothetical protein